MPRDNQGIYSLPAGSLVSNGDLVLPSQHNPPLQDIATALTGSLPRSGVAGMLAPLNHGGFKATNIAAGTDPSDAVTVGQLASQGIPIGGGADFWGDNPPDGWFLCYGQAISRSEYAALFSAIGVKYGPGDGSTTFNLPDCRGRVSAGRDDMGGAAANRLTTVGGVDADTMGATGGGQTQTLTVGQTPAHFHIGATDSAGVHNHDGRVGTFIGSNVGQTYETGQGSSAWLTSTVSQSGAHSHSFTTNTIGSGEAHPNVQPTIVSNKIIRAR